MTTFTTYVPFLKLVFVGVAVASLITGGLALNAVALTLLIAVILVATRADVIPALIAIAVGVVIVLVFPQFSLAGLDPVTALLCVALMLML
jgi:hypothetical protein